MQIATSNSFDMKAEGNVFSDTFRILDEALGEWAFRRWNGNSFSGKFLMSVFEVIATGVSHNVLALNALEPAARNRFVTTAAQMLWSNDVFTSNSGAGVRGTTRLTKLLPIAPALLRPPAN